MMILMQPTKHHAQEPPKIVASALKNCDIYFCPTKFSLSHTKARRDAKKAGARGATLPGITEASFIRGMSADYRLVKRIGERIEKKMKRTKLVHLLAKGTDMLLPIAGRRIDVDDGVLSHRGNFHNLPSGECGGSPIEGRSSGHFTTLDYNVLMGRRSRIVVRKGLAIGVKGNPKLKKLLWHYNNARNVAEFSIGCNPTARISGITLEDEKVLGTCHIALGDNKSYGGSVKADVHWDFVIEKPTIYFDSRCIMREGELMI
jgi:leucyl aminopeptidase (aminopeptidase T)